MQDRGPQLAGVTATLFALSIVAVGLRSYVRLGLTKSFGYDDWLMLAALLFYSLFCIFAFVGIHHGTGKHVSELTPQQFSAAMKTWFFAEIFYGLSSTLIKLAAGSQLLRLTIHPLHRRIIWTMMIIAGIFGAAFVAQTITQCHPVNFFWSATRNPDDGHCMAAKTILGFSYAQAAISSLEDWTFGILPAFIVKGLNMDFRTKASVFLILCLANVGSVATLVRIKAIHQISISSDFLFATVDLAIWSSVEVGLAIVAASIATYRPLFRTFFSLGSANRITTNNSRRIHAEGYIKNGMSHNVGLEEIARPRKSMLSQTSTTEIWGGVGNSGRR